MIESTKRLLAERRNMELVILGAIRDFEEETGLCVSSIALKHKGMDYRADTRTESTCNVLSEVLL